MQHTRSVAVLLALSAYVVAGAETASAQTVSWDDGGIGKNWSTVANGDAFPVPRVPQATDAVSIGNFAAAIDDTVILDVSTTARSFSRSIPTADRSQLHRTGRRSRYSPASIGSRLQLSDQWKCFMNSPFEHSYCSQCPSLE